MSVNQKRPGPGRAPSPNDWFELDLRLQAVGSEERTVASIRAWRDPKRPRLWERQLATPIAPPQDAGTELADLDAFYRQGGAEQWSLVGLEGGVIDSWSQSLESRDLSRDRYLLMEKETRAVELEPGVVVLDGPDRFDAYERVRRRLAPGVPMSGVVADLIGVQKLQMEMGHEVVVFAFEQDRELVAYMTFIVVGELCWMEDLETRADLRGRGIASALLRSSDGEARRRGATRTAYYAEADGWPTGWYRRAGWRVAGNLVRYRRTL